MNYPRVLSFAIPGAIIAFSILGNAITSAARRGGAQASRRRHAALPVWIEIGLGAALLTLVAIYGFENLT